MITPCIKVCQMDPERGLCMGCGRTLDEIGRWSAMTEAEREKVFKVLEKRKEEGAVSDIFEASVPPLA